MARIRSVHPGFFTDERCVLVSAFARLLFIGVWGQCDDYGVFEWKPTTLKMRVFPNDDVNVVALLEELLAADCVKQIAVGGKDYGLVRNFSKYQRPKSPKSYYPLPDEYRSYVNPKIKKGEPLPHNFPTDTENDPQREDGGEEEVGDKKGEGEPAREASLSDLKADDAEFVEIAKAEDLEIARELTRFRDQIESTGEALPTDLEALRARFRKFLRSGFGRKSEAGKTGKKPPPIRQLEGVPAKLVDIRNDRGEKIGTQWVDRIGNPVGDMKPVDDLEPPAFLKKTA